MKLVSRVIIPNLLTSLCLLAVSATVPGQGSGGEKHHHAGDASPGDDAASLQKKANEVQARIRENQTESDQLKKAIKTNEVALAKEILVRNGFTTRDLENAKINLRTGGGKRGEDTIEISVACCDPKEITIRRTLEHFTKTSQ